MGDTERASLAETVDRPRSRQELDRPVELAALRVVAQAGDRGRGGIGETEQKMAGIAAVFCALLQRLEALGIVGPPVAQARAEQFLQL